ncbi:MAG: metallophosphoesterase [Clostridia bacterium]|nr:metallophosphoesterase [Clostridia bacterium]MDD4798176.1 metallophosphoesterase [Clostridia bacterium]
MKVFAISDLHLSLSAPAYLHSGAEFAVQKPMDIFGEHWQGYLPRLIENWQKTVSAKDAVLMCGDTSWAMTLDEAKYDFDFLGKLNGTVYLSRGNHDYWWGGITKLRTVLPANVVPLNHDCAVVAGRAVCATRGWLLPGCSEWKASTDTAIYLRELLRLEMALQAGASTGLPLVAMLHYPPFDDENDQGEMMDLLEKYGVSLCVYGHIHGICPKSSYYRRIRGIDLYNVSCDRLAFTPLLLWED